MAIAELSLDLIDKIKTIPALGNRVGMAAAGGPSDPAMQNVPLPAAWLMYAGDSIIGGGDRGSQSEDIAHQFTLVVMLSYTNQTDIINNQLPTLEAIARSVSGKDSTGFALRWKYQGAQLVDIYTDRLVYELRFMVSSSYTI
jgi:hypothetical protein